ncbi:MAG: cytochrome C peroxidase, partial [SAR324 cluster bacterium]|nr:cytochrome C peroxidase [SAR324 cluster bacterium]
PCNPCAANSNPCNPCNPCGGKPAYKKSIYKTPAEAIADGNKLFHDKSLSGTNTMACTTCHNKDSEGVLDLTQSKAWPHHVEMGGGIVTLDQMIQICMVKPMQSQAFSWDDPSLVALSTYVLSLTK